MSTPPLLKGKKCFVPFRPWEIRNADWRGSSQSHFFLKKKKPASFRTTATYGMPLRRAVTDSRGEVGIARTKDASNTVKTSFWREWILSEMNWPQIDYLKLLRKKKQKTNIKTIQQMSEEIRTVSKSSSIVHPYRKSSSFVHPYRKSMWELTNWASVFLTEETLERAARVWITGLIRLEPWLSEKNCIIALS